MDIIVERLDALNAEARSKYTSRETTPEVFWSHVDRTGSCWTWTGRTDDSGYGRIGFQRHQNVGAHRVAWALTHAGVLPAEWVPHRCDNPPCVNPDHLFLGDATDNNRDRQQKGRTRGWAGLAEAEHHSFKVSADLAARMSSMRDSGATQKDISNATGISRGHVSKILRGQTVASRKVA